MFLFVPLTFVIITMYHLPLETWRPHHARFARDRSWCLKNRCSNEIDAVKDSCFQRFPTYHLRLLPICVRISRWLESDIHNLGFDSPRCFWMVSKLCLEYVSCCCTFCFNSDAKVSLFPLESLDMEASRTSLISFWTSSEPPTIQLLVEDLADRSAAASFNFMASCPIRFSVDDDVFTLRVWLVRRGSSKLMPSSVKSPLPQTLEDMRPLST